MVDQEFDFKQKEINELAAKYRSASVPERKLIKERLYLLFTEIYKDRPTGFSEYNDVDHIDEMTTLLCGLNKKDGTCILDDFMESNKDGNFYAYMTGAIHNRFINRKRRDKVKRGDKSAERFVPFDTMENIPDDKDRIEDDIERKDNVRSFIILMLNAEFEKHLSKKQNNANRQLYTMLFFTEQFTDFCKILYKEDKDNPSRAALMDKETLMFETINVGFLDHVMEDLCRRISEVSDSEYKQNKCFDIKQSPEKRISPEFNAKVFISFLKNELNKSVSNAVITQQRGNYRELIKKCVINAALLEQQKLSKYSLNLSLLRCFFLCMGC